METVVVVLTVYWVVTPIDRDVVDPPISPVSEAPTL